MPEPYMKKKRKFLSKIYNQVFSMGLFYQIIGRSVSVACTEEKNWSSLFKPAVINKEKHEDSHEQQSYHMIF